MTRGSALVHLNGRVVRADEAVISALSPALSHGPVVFETVRGYWNTELQQLFLFRVHDHLRRLAASLRILRFDESPAIDELAGQIIEVVRRNAFKEDIHIRMQVFPQERNAGRAIPTRPAVLIVAQPCSNRHPGPVACQVSAWRRPGDDALPSRVKNVGSRVFANTAMAEAKADGYDQVILLSDRGKVAEGVSSNIFLVRSGVAVTPDLSSSILEGVTRTTLIELLREQAIACHERAIDRSELYDCEEALLCSTQLEVLPIGSIDRLPVGTGTEGPVTRLLRERYQTIARGECEERRNWRMPAY